MINPSIESSDFLFWHERMFEVVFWKLCGKETNKISWIQIHCVCKHTLNLYRCNSPCLFTSQCSKNDIDFFRCQITKSELSIDVLIIYWSLQSLLVRQRQNIFCEICQKVESERPSIEIEFYADGFTNLWGTFDDVWQLACISIIIHLINFMWQAFILS